MTSAITVSHNFETGHRLPHLSGKCENLHGHSWWAEVTVATPVDTEVVVEFGTFKKALRGWIDTHLDHGLMLGAADPLLDVLSGAGKVYRFGGVTTPEHPAHGLEWPTVENVARLLGRVAAQELAQIPRAQDATVVDVLVSETHVNSARWAVE